MEENSCSTYRDDLWDFAAGRLNPRESKAIAQHVQECRECQFEVQDMASMKQGFRALPQKTPPPILHTRLQVLASREHSRQVLRRTMAIRFHEFRSRFKLTFDHLFKPLMVPASGGLLASFLCFGVIVGSLHLDRNLGVDVPIGLFTSVVLEAASPFSTNSKDVMVLLTVDEKGNVSDFTLPQGAASSDEMQAIGNLVLYSTFKPATRLGIPVSSKILFNIQHMRVKG